MNRAMHGMFGMILLTALAALPGCKNSFSDIIPSDGSGCDPVSLIKVPDQTVVGITLGESLTFAVIPEGGCGERKLTWLLDGADEPISDPNFVFNTSSRGVGSYELEARVADDGGSSVARWTVSVSVTGLSIVGTTPPVGNVTVNEGSAREFQAFFSGGSGNPLIYTVLINGTPVGSTPSFTWTASSYVAGNFTLRITASDGVNTAEAGWLLKNNYAPTISSFLPITAPLRVAYDGSQAFSVSATDPNGDTLQYEWQVDGNSSQIPATTSAVTWSNPGVPWVGTRTVKAIVSDGSLSREQSWTVQVNHFFQECNTLASGHVCTAAGDPDVGNGLNPSTFPAGIRLQPRYLHHSSSDNVTYIADSVSDAVWAWNRSATDLTKFGVSLPAGRIKVVAGSGVNGFAGDGGQALEAQINVPMSMVHYSGPTNPGLYIADHNSNRIRYVSPGGFISSVSAIGTDCTRPARLILRGSEIYMSCYNEHIVLKYDIETNTLSHVLGRDTAAPWSGTASSPPGSLGDGATPMNVYLRNPSGLAFDPNGNLYVYSSGDCRLWFLNNSAGNVDWYDGAISVAPGTARVLAGSTTNNTCGDTLGGAPYSATNVGYLRNGFGAIALANFSGGLPREIYLSSTGSHDVRVINLTGAAKSFGSTPVVVAHNTIMRVVGTGSGTYLNDNVDAAVTRLNQPHALLIDPVTGKLLIGDFNNFRVRWVDFSDWKIDRVMGAGYGRADNFGGGALPVRENYFNNPVSVVHDTARNAFYFADMSNHLIRKVDLATGLSSTITGFGSGSSLTQDDVPTNVLMNNPQAVIVHGNGLVYADTNNCAVRVHNLGSAQATFFGITISANRVSSIAGSPGNCATTGSGGLASSAFLNQPSGLASDGSSLYIAERNSHCIRRIDASGTIHDFAGECGTSGNLPNFPATASAANMRLNLPEQLAISSDGLLIIADRGNSRIRVVNTSAVDISVGGVSVTAGMAGTVAGGGASTGDGAVATGSNIGTVYGVAIDSDYVYFASESQHVVRRFQRATGVTSTIFGRASASGGHAGSPFDLTHEGVASTEAYLWNPRGVAPMGADMMLVADRSNHLIRLMTP